MCVCVCVCILILILPGKASRTLVCRLFSRREPGILYSTTKETHQSFLGGIMENKHGIKHGFSRIIVR